VFGRRGPVACMRMSRADSYQLPLAPSPDELPPESDEDVPESDEDELP